MDQDKDPLDDARAMIAKDKSSKAPAKKASVKKKVPAEKLEVAQVYLINWKEAANQIEAELKARDWDSAKQRRNPRFINGLVLKYVVGPLVTSIHQLERGE